VRGGSAGKETMVSAKSVVLMCESSAGSAKLAAAIKEAGYSVRVVGFDAEKALKSIGDDEVVIVALEGSKPVDSKILDGLRSSGKCVLVAGLADAALPAEFTSIANDFLFEPFTLGEIRLRLAKRIQEHHERNLTGVNDKVVRREMFLRSLQGLIATMEAKDPYTRGHSARVAQMAKLLSEKMGLLAVTQTKVKFSGLFHDIGKIGIPERIINKASRLTTKEMEIMMQHPDLGVKIMEQITADKTILDAILYHHERVDGEGHMGLAGEDIPIEARILAVAEAADTMLSKTPYREPMSLDTVRGELRGKRGSQFDTKVADAFLKLTVSQLENIAKTDTMDAD